MVLVATITTLAITNSINGSGNVKSSGFVGGNGIIGNGGTEPSINTWGPSLAFNLVVDFLGKLW
jgi:hypothetical protein